MPIIMEVGSAVHRLVIQTIFDDELVHQLFPHIASRGNPNSLNWLLSLTNHDNVREGTLDS